MITSESTITLPGYTRPQQDIILTARDWIAEGALVLDCEATGLEPDAQIIEISILDLSGQVLLETLVKPTKPIPAASTLIHGIDDAMVACAPSWAEVHEQVWGIIRGRDVLAYGMDFDYRLLRTNAAMHDKPVCDDIVISDEFVLLTDRTAFHCLMRTYAQLWQEPTKHPRNSTGWRWKSLTAACEAQGIPTQGAHRATADCRMKQALIHAMANAPKVCTPKNLA